MAVWWTQGGERPRAEGSIVGPEDQEPERVSAGQRGSTAACLASAQLLALPAPVTPGRPCSSCGGPVQSGDSSRVDSQPRPQPGLRFHLCLAELEGAGKPPQGSAPVLHPTVPQSTFPFRVVLYQGTGMAEDRGNSYQDGPVPATCTLLVLEPHSTP